MLGKMLSLASHQSEMAFPIFLSLIAVAAAAVTLTQAVGPSPDWASLEEHSLSVSTILTVYLQDGKHYKYEVEEAYSAPQRRARIRYQTVGPVMPSQAERWLPREGTFYVTNRDVVLVNETNRGCYQSDVPALRALFDYLPEEADEHDSALSYVLGPARILYLIERRRDQMTRGASADSVETERRNVPSVMYTLVYPTPSQGNIQLTIFYSKEAGGGGGGNLPAAANHGNRHQIPLEVILETNSKMTVVYSFVSPVMGARQLDDELHFSAKLDSDSADATVELDLFAIEPSLGCGRLVVGEGPQSGSRADAEVLQLPTGPKLASFSFRSKLESNGYEDDGGDYMDEFVAYDGPLSSMRVDSFSSARYSTRLSNFYLGKTYSVVERPGNSADPDPVFGNILNLASGGDGGDGDPEGDGEQQQVLACVAIEAQSSQSAAQGMELTLGEILLGANRLRYLGRGRVRGIQALVYEAHDAVWPVWVRQPAVYYRGNLGQTHPERNVRPNNKGADYVLNTVVYFSAGAATPTASSAAAAANSSRREDSGGGTWWSGRPGGQLLLQIEFNRLRRENDRLHLIERITRHIHDFEWALKSHGPLGQPVEEYFSPVDMCPAAEEEGNHYGRVEMVAEAQLNSDGASGGGGGGGGRSRPSKWPNLSWLSVAKARNLAYLRALQYTMPITMVHDLRTRLSTDQQQQQQQRANPMVPSQPPIKLISSFRFSEHDRRVARLTLLGDGVPRVMFKRDLHTTWLSFSSCALVAAHRKVNTYFAYLAKSETCVVDTRPADTTASGLHQTIRPIDTFPGTSDMPFQLQTNGSYEIYRVTHELDTSLPVYDSATGLAHGPKRFDYFKNKEKSTFVLALDERDASGDQVTFRIESLKVTEDNEKNFYRLDNSSLPDANKFLGLGLVEADTKYNRRIVSLVDEDLSWSRGRRRNRSRREGASHGRELEFGRQLSFAQCQAACLADPSCRSYSFCIRGPEVECLLSTVGFRDASLVLQLMELMQHEAARPRPGSAPMFALNIDESNRIQVRRHANCELHNKNYLALFGPPDRQRRPLMNRRIYGVTGREQCAQLCFDHIVDLLRQDLKSSQASISLLEDPASDPAALAEALEAHKATAASLIRAMMYFDAAYLESIPEETRVRVRRHMLEPNRDGFTDGYCVLGDRMTASERQHFEAIGRPLENDDLGLTVFQVERYPFRFETFYERQPDVELRASPAPAQLGRTRAAESGLVSRSEVASRADYELLRSFIERGDNKQSMIHVLNRETNCAYRCFVQWSEAWPPCRSFDLVLSSTAAAGGGGGGGANEMAYCQLNSITLRQAVNQQRFDLIENNPDKTYRVWHFDPTPGLMLAEVDQDGRFRLAELAAGLARDRARWGPPRLGPGALLLCSLVALAGGLALGLALGTRYIGGGGREAGAQTRAGRAAAAAGDDTSQLVERQTVEFSNLVNFEGKIE